MLKFVRCTDETMGRGETVAIFNNSYSDSASVEH